MSAYQPRRPTTCQRPRLRPPRLLQLSRHPDACLFIPSRTVTDEPAIARQSERRHGLGRAIGRDPDGARRLGRTVLVPRLLAYVEHEDPFPPAQQVIQLREGDPIRHGGLHPATATRARAPVGRRPTPTPAATAPR